MMKLTLPSKMKGSVRQLVPPYPMTTQDDNATQTALLVPKGTAVGSFLAETWANMAKAMGAMHTR